MTPCHKETNVAAARWIKYCYLAYFSQPKEDRELYRLVKARRVSRIVELGVLNLQRTTRLIEVARRYSGEPKVHYAGLDWFDTRSSELPPLSLKQAHRVLHASGAQVRLVPGAPGHALASVANALQNTDLVYISQAVSDDDLQRAWFYLPRMLCSQSVVLRERAGTQGRPELAQLSASELAERAAQSTPRRAA